MTNAEAGKLPEHLQKQEGKLVMALTNLRAAYDLAIRAEEQLKVTLQNAERVLDDNALLKND